MGKKQKKVRLFLQFFFFQNGRLKNWVFQPPPKAEQFPPKFHGLVLGLVGLKCPHKINFITQCMSARRATCEGVGCFGWESWINSPWLSMSVRAIPIRNQKKMHGWDCIFWLLQHRSSNHWATTIEATDYGCLERKLPSLHGRKFNPNPKFLGMSEAYFVCHIGPIFQISLIYVFIGRP